MIPVKKTPERVTPWVRISGIGCREVMDIQVFL